MPNIRAETPLSVWPLAWTPESPFSISSMKTMHGAIASAIRRACRVRSSVIPTSEPISAPMSSMSVGRPTSLPRALQNALLPVPARRAGGRLEDVPVELEACRPGIAGRTPSGRPDRPGRRTSRRHGGSSSGRFS